MVSLETAQVLAKNPGLQSKILTITIRAVSGLLRKKAKTLGLKQKLEFAVEAATGDGV